MVSQGLMVKLTYPLMMPYIFMYMGGVALMVISPKIWEFLSFFMSTLGIIQPHFKSFSDFI